MNIFSQYFETMKNGLVTLLPISLLFVGYLYQRKAKENDELKTKLAEVNENSANDKKKALITTAQQEVDLNETERIQKGAELNNALARISKPPGKA